MSKTAMVRARMEPQLKSRTEFIFERLGINATQAITLFYRQVAMRQGLPFAVVVPTATTKRTFEATDADRDLVLCKSAKDMFNKLDI